ASGALTETGAAMARYPLHPRLARLVIEAARRGAQRDGRAIAALLSAGARVPSNAERSGPSDLLLLLESEWDPQTRPIFPQLVRLASAIEPEWLLDLYPDQLKERATLEWNRAAERVEATNALVYGALVLEESRSSAPDPEQAAQLLSERAREAGIALFADAAE